MENENLESKTSVFQCQKCEKIRVENSFYSKEDWEKLKTLGPLFANQYSLYEIANKEKTISHGVCPYCKDTTEEQNEKDRSLPTRFKKIGNYAEYIKTN